MSHNTGTVQPAEHLAWLASTLANPDRELLIAEQDGQVVGTVRIDRHHCDVAELSWTVAPQARGNGIGKRMVRATVEMCALYPVVAEIKSENIASIRIAKAVGMELIKTEGGVSHFAKSQATR